MSDLARLADERMYKNKEAYYKNKGIDRVGQRKAYDAICASYTKILKVNLTTDKYNMIKVDESEMSNDKGYHEKISEWLKNFALSGQVHDEDAGFFLKRTGIEYLRKYFAEGRYIYNIKYRRKIEEEYKDVIMEMVRADEYTESNQIVFLYVKNISL